MSYEGLHGSLVDRVRREEVSPPRDAFRDARWHQWGGRLPHEAGSVVKEPADGGRAGAEVSAKGTGKDMTKGKDKTADELKMVASEMLVSAVSDLRDDKLVTCAMKLELAQKAIQGLKRLIDEGRLSPPDDIGNRT